MMFSTLAEVDAALLGLLTAYRTAWLDTVMPAISDLGARGFLWLVVAAILFLYPLRRAGAFRVLLTIGFTYLIVDVALKELMWRARPFDVLPDIQLLVARPATSSFPSGHAASAVAGALASARVLPEARVVCWSLAAAIAYSRLYVGVHFPLDVIAGAVVGALCALFVLGGRPASTYASSRPQMLLDRAVIRP